MKPSHYLKVFPYPKKPGYSLVFSTRKASSALLSKQKYESMEKGCLASDDETVLAKLGMIVPDVEAEKQSVYQHIDSVNQANPWLNITVILNLDCNFACTYCYEQGIKGSHYMTDETASDLIQFIIKRFTPEKKHLSITFHGGEPLLSADLLKTIARPLKMFTQDRGDHFDFNIITNGSLLTGNRVKEMVDLGLKRVQVTLDGPADIHNHNRPFKTGAPSYDVIINNIREIRNLVSVSIGGNVESHNYREFTRLLDDLKNSGLGPDAVNHIRFGTVMKHPQGDAFPESYVGGCVSTDEPWVAEALLFLREEILKHGYKTGKIRPGACMINYQHAYVVNYDGALYKCPVFTGMKEYQVGDLKTGLGKSNQYKNGYWKKHPDCPDCAYLPLCYGGCRYMSMLKTGDVNNVECKKGFLDKALEKMIRQDIAYKI